jgi:hypothetical protein
MKSRSLILILLLQAAQVLACSSEGPIQMGKSKKVAQKPEAPKGETVKEIKLLSEGQLSPVADPFIAVARDVDTYSELRSSLKNLPDLDSDFFKSSAVIAIFLGTRNTAGFDVEISSSSANFVIKEVPPPSDAMVAQMISRPFKVVSVPHKPGAPILLDFGKPWQDFSRPYKVSTGEFNMSGGIAGKQESYKLEGDITIIRFGSLGTVALSLRSAGSKKMRNLRDISTGVFQTDSAITIKRLSPGTLLDQPYSPFQARLNFLEPQKKVQLDLMSTPPAVNDGYSGLGRLEGTTDKPAPQRRKPVLDEE